MSPSSTPSTVAAACSLLCGSAVCLYTWQHHALNRLSVFLWLGFAALLLPILSSMDENPTPSRRNMASQEDQPPPNTTTSRRSFPWNDTGSSNSTGTRTNNTKYLMSLFGFNLLGSFFDWEERRSKKWDQERRKWRELQQQLATLRAVRAQRQRALLMRNKGLAKDFKDHIIVAGREGERQSSEEQGVQVQRVLPGGEEQSMSSLSAFPWKSHGDSTKSSTCLRIGSITSVFHYRERKRKLRWDSEVKRWRQLQQQLMSLQAARSKRAASGSPKASFYPSLEVQKDRLRDFPWNE